MPQTSPAARLDSALLAIWIAACLLTLGAFGGALLRLRRLRSAAEIRDVGGVRVTVTRTTGPFVAGLVRSEILIPIWVLSLDDKEQRLVIAHEQEHVRGRDPALLAFAALCVSLAPWNPILWYMFGRIRQAIELDCDHRVLKLYPDPRAYAGLLLAVACRRQPALIPLPGLAASVSSLEQRFRLMTMNPNYRARPIKLLATLGIVSVLLVATAMIPRPIPAANGHNAVHGMRATGLVRVMALSGPVTFRVYSTGGSFIDADAPGEKRDTLTRSLSGQWRTEGKLFKVDVTNGAIHFVSKDSASLHIEAAMSGSSPALWLSATGQHLVLDRGGSGVRGAR